MDAGFYGPDSITWRLTRERVVLLGGARALLMQLAHPLVAAGVADHSQFRRDPFARLRRTLDATLTIVFGTTEEAEAAAAGINAVHSRVHGTLGESVGRFPAGTPYDARDPELLLWVQATLIDTTLAFYPRYVAPLSEDEMEAAYEESKIAARLLLVPDETMPATLEEFRAYVDGTIASDAIEIGGFQRDLARDVLYPPVRWIPRPVFELTTAITAGMLPEKLRAGFGLDMTPARRRMYELSPVLVRALRTVLLPVPPISREPHARRAYRRLSAR